MIANSSENTNTATHTDGSGNCVYSSNAGNTAEPHASNGEIYKWVLESTLLKVTDNRGGYI